MLNEKAPIYVEFNEYDEYSNRTTWRLTRVWFCFGSNCHRLTFFTTYMSDGHTHESSLIHDDMSRIYFGYDEFRISTSTASLCMRNLRLYVIETRIFKQNKNCPSSNSDKVNSQKQKCINVSWLWNWYYKRNKWREFSSIQYTINNILLDFSVFEQRLISKWSVRCFSLCAPFVSPTTVGLNRKHKM